MVQSLIKVEVFSNNVKNLFTIVLINHGNERHMTHDILNFIKDVFTAQNESSLGKRARNPDETMEIQGFAAPVPKRAKREGSIPTPHFSF